jgi:hypothetical protein
MITEATCLDAASLRVLKSLESNPLMSSWGQRKLNEGYTLMTHKTYIAMATAFALALGSLSPALAEDASTDDKAGTATEGTEKPATDAPDKAAE